MRPIVLSAAAWLAFSSSGEAQPATDTTAPVRLDRHGDTLPAGAIQRFGTSRFWAERSFLSADFSPDGKWIASGHDYNNIRIWDAATGKQLRVLQGHGSDEVLAVVFSPDGRRLATRTGGSLFRDNNIRIWDAATWKLVRSFAGFKLDRDRGQSSGDHGVFFDLAFTPDGKAILTGPGDNEDKTHVLSMWDVDTGQLIRTFHGHTATVRCFAIAPDGRTVATGSADKTVRLWDLKSGNELHQFKDHTAAIAAVAFSPDSKLMASAGGEDGTIRLWDVAAGKLVRKLSRLFGNRTTMALACTPDGKTLLAGDGRGSVTLWNVDTGQVREEIESVHPRAIRALRLSRDAERLVVLGYGGSGREHFLIVWNVLDKRPHLPEIQHHHGAVLAIAISADDKWLASSGEDGQAWIWDCATAKVVRRLPRENHHVDLLHFPAPQTLYTGGFMGMTPRLWDVGTGRSLQSLEFAAIAAAFSADGKWFANAWPTEVHLFHRQTGRMTARYKLPQGDSIARKSLVFTPDGQLLLWGDRHGLGILETKSGKVVERIDEDRGFDFIALSPDGKLLATTGGFSLWDWQRKARVRRLPARTKHVVGPQEMQFSPNGLWVAAVGSDLVLRVWEAATGLEVRNYRPYVQEQGWARFESLAWTPDSRCVVTCGRDAQILQWDVTGRLQDGKLRAASLSGQDLDRHWAALSGGDGEKAFDAMWALASAPATTLPFLEQRLAPVPAADAALVAKYIQALDSVDFEERDRATTELGKFEALAEPALRRTLETMPPLETRRRVEALLDKARDKPLDGDRLRQVRALAILDEVGAALARPLVERLAKGAPAARQTQEARRVLGQWAQVR